MGVKFRCERCRRKILVPDEFAKRLISCPACGEATRVPETSTEPPSHDAASPSSPPAPTEESKTYERTCPGCGRRILVDNEWADVVCRQCGTAIPGARTEA